MAFFKYASSLASLLTDKPPAAFQKLYNLLTCHLAQGHVAICMHNPYVFSIQLYT